jgi:hypothetical protein
VFALVLLVLATKANDKGEVLISLKEIRQQTRMNDAQVRGGLEQLITTKHVAVKWPTDGLDVLGVQLSPGKGWQVQR